MSVLPVSVILPNYNYSQYINSRIDNILYQTYPVSELIILDDASTDDSIKTIQQKIATLRQTHPDLRITTLFNQTNSGNVFKQWQKGINAASHEYIWICEIDDSCKPDFLATAMRGFEHNQPTILSFTDSRFINESGRRVLKSELRHFKNFFRENRPKSAYIRSGREELTKVLAFYNTIPNVSAVVFKKSPEVNLDIILSQAAEFHLAGDWYFYSELLLHGDIAYSPCRLNLHRIHPGSVTSNTNKKLHLQEIRRIHDKIIKDLDLDSKTQARIRQYEGKLAAKWQINP